eukprot:s196_g10.t1
MNEQPEGEEARQVSAGQLIVNWFLGASGTPSRCRKWGFDPACSALPLDVERDLKPEYLDPKMLNGCNEISVKPQRSTNELNPLQALQTRVHHDRMGARESARSLTARLARAGSAEEVLVLVSQNLKRLDRIHSTTSLHLLAKHSLRDDRLVKPILKVLLSLQHELLEQGELDARQLSNTLWALARLRNVAVQSMPPELANKVAAQLASQSSDKALRRQLKPQDISNGLWAMAALDFELPEQALLMPTLVAKGLASPELFRTQELANSLRFEGKGTVGCLFALLHS